MARKPPRSKAAPSAPALPPPGGTDRDKIIAAFMALLAEKRFEQIGFGDISASAGVSLATVRTEFGSTLAILAAHMKELDRKVLAGEESDMAGEPPRERLFDVLMRRIEAMAPHREATRSLMKSASCNPGLAVALNGASRALADLDDDRGRHRRGRAARHDPRARPRGAVRLGAAHLGR